MPPSGRGPRHRPKRASPPPPRPLFSPLEGGPGGITPPPTDRAPVRDLPPDLPLGGEERARNGSRASSRLAVAKSLFQVRLPWERMRFPVPEGTGPRGRAAPSAQKLAVKLNAPPNSLLPPPAVA